MASHTKYMWIPSLLLAAAAFVSQPRVGEPAPGFSLLAADRSTVSLKDYSGKAKVILVFYRGYW